MIKKRSSPEEVENERRSSVLPPSLAGKIIKEEPPKNWVLEDKESLKTKALCFLIYPD